MASSNGSVKLEVSTEDKTANKWKVALAEEVFMRFLTSGDATVQKVFGDGSLFSPYLFGKYFDPSDAFPLWEFESEVLLSNLRSSGQCRVDWSQTEQAYVLKAELLGIGKNNLQVYMENAKVMEISGQWKQPREAKAKDWRSGQWWNHGYVRRLELPDDSDTKNSEAFVTGDAFLEIRIPKNNLNQDGQNKRGDE